MAVALPLLAVLALPLTGCGAARRPGDPRVSRTPAPAHARAARSAHPARGDCAPVPAPTPAPTRTPRDGVTVIVGASIANGFRTSRGALTAWPHLLTARLRDARVQTGIAGDSVSASRLLADIPGRPCTSALHREPAALAVPGVGTLILTDLINDIQQTPHVDDPGAIITGLRAFVTHAHACGVRVIATTITPYDGLPGYTVRGERCRQAINAFIRSGGLFDGVIDFDAALRDPAHPSRMRPADDSGDHLHPDDAGQRAMAAAIPLSLLAAPSAPPTPLRRA